MFQIRIHGRGGQGVVTAAEIIAIAAFKDNYQAQAFPSFGVERTGAPIQAFARISLNPILVREQVGQPDIIIIQDPTLIGLPEISNGANAKTRFIINSSRKNSELAQALQATNKDISPQNVITIDATSIAIEILKKNITNTVVLGAFAKATGIISLKSLEEAISEKFSGKGEAIIAVNQQAVASAYENVCFPI